jgi:acyl-CoA hydrolase
MLSEASSLYVSACAAEIEALPDWLKAAAPRDATVTGLFTPLVNHRAYAVPEIELRARTFLLTRELKRLMAQGWVEYCPWRYSRIDAWMGAPRRFDTAAIMLSSPDEYGMCSLGVQSDFFPALHKQVDRIIGFINPQMPHTDGHAKIAIRELAATVDYDVPLLTMDIREADTASATIARLVAGLVPDGATIQLGTGQIPSEVLAQLTNHRNLRVHTGIVDDNILKLEQSGALDLSFPIVTGTAIGSKELYEALVDKRRFALKPVSYTHAYANTSPVQPSSLRSTPCSRVICWVRQAVRRLGEGSPLAQAAYLTLHAALRTAVADNRSLR